MTWDWAIDTFKGLIVAGSTWTVIYLRKQAKPLVRNIRKFSRLVETTEELSRKVAILESRQEGMYDIIRDPLYILNEKAEMTYCNNAYAKIFGLNDPRDAYGMGWMQLIPDADKKRMAELTEMNIAHPSSYDDEVRFQHKVTDKIINTECRTALIINIDKKVVGTIGRLYVIP